MKKIFAILAISSSLLLLGGCNVKDDYSSEYSSTSDTNFAFVKDGTLVTDNDVTFIITEDETDGNWKNEERIYYSVDITGAISTAVYSAALTEYLPVEITDLHFSSDTPIDSLRQDPIYFITGTTSGVATRSYLNFFCQYVGLQSSNTPHKITVVKDEELSDASTIVVTLCHDGNGEFYTAGKQTSLYAIYTKIFSIPTSQIMPYSSGTSFDLVIKYDWFTDDNYSERDIYASENTITLE